MNAKQAVTTWESRDNLDAFQPWEIVEIVDALISFFHEHEAAQPAQPENCPECGHANGYHTTTCKNWLWEPKLPNQS